MLIGLCGIAGSGKDTIADVLERKGWVRVSFASHVKSVCCDVFGWNREDVEGRTEDSRKWREERDHWWSCRLGFDVTPRKMLQYIGTDLFRKHFDENIWILSLAKKIDSLLVRDVNVVVTDVRFPNEAEMIRSYGGKIVKVIRTNDEKRDINVLIEDAKRLDTYETFKLLWTDFHESEYHSLRIEEDQKIVNEGTLADLEDKALSLSLLC